MKFNKKLLAVILFSGLATSMCLVSGMEDKVQASEEKVEAYALNTDRELYKSVSKDVKLPKKVIFRDEQKNQGMLEKINYGITNFMDNKAGEYIATSLSESSEGTKFYTHRYENNDASQRITFNVIGTETNIDTTGYDTKIVRLSNGIEATYAEGDAAQVLAFNSPKDNLYYALIGEKDVGKFTTEELIGIANSIE
ncbi:hypothetical protein BC30090_4870 [Bacillus cereus]|uniref:DUF4367 domain-containing protein n=1 Tax=unclassified Bacillus cereus group TaxID=2750818 RepID=UPI0022E1E5D3|nr:MULTISPECIES: DUF4367 domain-containing protein [unclassified Bacillus cereus group]MDU3869581.1 DUF4367 domain-containing protein [Bacillus paranthracis]BCD25973.1 hypothetical protein BC30090_4870 [Bacillus cereus]MDA1649527.1 DUF4367 domain-containing protein [Bacillus cereus group sp. TH160LC]MDA1778332.1 DUF4367 domain-containing protein [Bacillus cereus group sp. BY9-3LC]MDA1799690.1 DUF4367 domain-containing protein [Bacillus cereus group sp. BY6-1LC]